MCRLFGVFILLSCCLWDSVSEELCSFPSLPAPLSALVQAGDGAFYDTTTGGGVGGFGTIFRVTTNGQFTTLVSFTETNGVSVVGGLTLGADGALYGATQTGTIVRLTTNGTLTTLVQLDPFDGVESALLAGTDGFLYGTSIFNGLFRVDLQGDITWLASSGPLGPLVEDGNANFYGAAGSSVYQVDTSGTFTNLASFDYTNGLFASGPMVLLNGVLYGTSPEGGATNGALGWGTIFRLATNGDLTALVTFQEERDTNGNSYLPDGGQPFGGLTLGTDRQLYGTTSTGGLNGNGTVFRVSTNGALTTLANFPVESRGPIQTPLLQGTDGAFYGTADFGGVNNVGNVFRVTTNGDMATVFQFTNTEPASPQAGLLQGIDGAFYGVTPFGGAHNLGAVYRVATNGALTTLASFDLSGPAGYQPYGTLAQGQDEALYGTAAVGGAGGSGTIFRVSTNGLLTCLASFDVDGLQGVSPQSGLIKGSDGAFYGTCSYGGADQYGTVFQVTTNGSLTVLASFSGKNGAYPSAPLVQGCDGALYGFTAYSGSNSTNIMYGQGTVFRITTNGSLTVLTNLDGPQPDSALILGNDCAIYGVAGNNLFRIAADGRIRTSIGAWPSHLVQGPDGPFYGVGYNGVDRISTNGTVSLIASLDRISQPRGNLLLPGDGFLYGVAAQRGTRGGGSIYRVKIPDYRLRMQPLQINGNGYLNIPFIGEPGETYRVLQATNLFGPWQSLGTVTTSTDGTGLWGPSPPLPGSAFYRTVAP